MHPEQLRALGRRMNVINPCDGENPFGNCVACSIHAAHVLVDGGDFVWISNSYWSLSQHFGATKRFGEGYDRAERVWSWLNRRTIPGGVYILSDEDHTFNILRDYDGRLHLLDSNQQVYRTLNSLRDCEVLFRHPRTLQWRLLNHLGPGEGPMSLYYCGNLNEEFREVGTNGRRRANTV